MKKIGYILLALVMLLFLCYPIFAASPAQQLTPEQIAALIKAMDPNSDIEIVYTQSDAGSASLKESGSATGAGAIAHGDKLSDQITGSPPSVGLGQGREANGGGITRSTKAEPVQFTSLASNPFTWASILLLIGAGAALYFGARLAAMILAACGIVCATIAIYPAILLWAVVGMVVVLAAFYWYSAKTHVDTHEAARAMAEGIDSPLLSEAVKDQVKSTVTAAASEKDEEVIKKIKKADKLGKYAKL